MLLSCAVQHRAQDPECSRYPADNLHETSLLTSPQRSRITEDTQECAWVRRRTKDQLITKETVLSRTRANEAGDAVPGSQDSIPRGIGNLQIADIPAAQPDRVDFADPLSSGFAVYERTCDVLNAVRILADPHAYVGGSDGGLVVCMGQKHGGQSLTQGSVAQLDRAACVNCGTIRSRRGNRCNHCKTNTATRDMFVGDIFQDRRQSGHRDAAASQSNPHQPISPQPIPPGDPPDDSPLPNSPIRDIVTTERDAQLLGDLRWASSMATPRSNVSSCATAWEGSLERAVTGHQSWAIVCRHRCRLLLAEVPQGGGLQLWKAGAVHDFVGRFLGQQHTGQQGRAKNNVQPQTEEQRGKSACAPTARGSISKAMKRLVGRAITGSAECRKHWATALILRSSGQGTHLSSAERSQATQAAWVEADTKQPGRSNTGIGSLPHVNLAPMSAPEPMGERQSHLDAIIAFAGGGQKEDYSESSTFSQSSGLQEISQKNTNFSSLRSSCSERKTKIPLL